MPVYGPKEVIISSDNMLFERAIMETVKQCSRLVEYVFKSVINSQKFGTAVSTKIGKAIAKFF